MKTKLIATLLLAGSTMFAAPRISVGIGVGIPVGPGPAVAAVSPCPGPDYGWVAGSYVYVGGRPVWHGGYWQHRAFAPRYDARHFRR